MNGQALPGIRCTLLTLIVVMATGLHAETARGQIAESEDNGSAAQADSVLSGPYGEWAIGNINPIGDVDWWVIDGASPGDLVFGHADLSGAVFSDGEALLRFWADDGTTQIGTLRLPDLIAGEVVPQAGRVYVEMRDQSDNEEVAVYALFHAVVSPADAAMEQEPNDTPATATPVDRAIMHGTAAGADVDYFAFPATQGKLVQVIADNDPDANGRNMASSIELFRTDGVTPLCPPSGDCGDRGFDNPYNVMQISRSAPANGIYYVRITNEGTGADNRYSFVVLDDGHTMSCATSQSCVFIDGFET